MLIRAVSSRNFAVDMLSAAICSLSSVICVTSSSRL
jgi:hypothetical protein